MARWMEMERRHTSDTVHRNVLEWKVNDGIQWVLCVPFVWCRSAKGREGRESETARVKRTCNSLSHICVLNRIFSVAFFSNTKLGLRSLRFSHSLLWYSWVSWFLEKKERNKRKPSNCMKLNDYAGKVRSTGEYAKNILEINTTRHLWVLSFLIAERMEKECNSNTMRIPPVYLQTLVFRRPLATRSKIVKRYTFGARFSAVCALLRNGCILYVCDFVRRI